jgi:hypothetical protein
MTSFVQRIAKGRGSSCHSAVETIGNTSAIRSDPLVPGLAETESGSQTPLGYAAVEPTGALGPDNVNCRAGWPARKDYFPVPRWPKRE